MKINISISKIQMFGCLLIIAIMLYLLPGIWQSTNGDIRQQAAYLLSYVVILWSLGSVAYKNWLKSDSEETKNVTFTQFMMGDGFVSPGWRAFGSIAFLLLFAYQTPELWEHTNGDITRQGIHIACSLGLLWICGRNIVQYFSKNTAHE